MNLSMFAMMHKQFREHKGLRPQNYQDIAVILLVLASIASGAATYAAFREMPPFGNGPRSVIWLLNLDLVLLLVLVGFIAKRLVGVWRSHKRGLTGSHLHVRLVYIFSILAAAPVIIMTVFSAVFFYYGVHTWFSERVSTAVNESQAVAEAYLKEHRQTIRADTLAMANDLNREAGMLLLNEQAFDQVMQTHSLLRDLSEAIIFDDAGRVLARSGLTFSLEFEDIPLYAMEGADSGEVVIMTGGNEDRVRALVKLDNFSNAYLFVGRMIDPQVLSHLAATKQATQDYATLQERLSDLQVTMGLIFAVVGLILLMSAIWFGLLLARQLVQPISTMITTADSVRAGDLSAQVPPIKGIQEFDYLAQSFNRMTRRLQEQQNELLQANRQLDRRRHFTETVLTGVSSGVIALDEKGLVSVANVSACDLLGLALEDVSGKNITKIIPELSNLLEEAHGQPEKITQGEIPLLRQDELRRTFLVRVAIEWIGDQETGVILTFDDITELQSAQRKAAWADVARRIAHEIKNPLTPIQLSAERLNRRYLKQIEDDPETFKRCTETIIRHVEDIGRMVNEFSSFARMPEPVMHIEDVQEQVRDVVSLHKQAHSDVKIEFVQDEREGEVLSGNLDAQQIRQAINNLVQNALDSIQGQVENRRDEKGRIAIFTGRHEDEIFVAVSDNGAGFPEGEERGSLTEPYVTHKQKGTGLGLAIVKKIMEDHNGRVILGVPQWLKAYDGWRDLGGATAVLVLSAAHGESVRDEAA
ncbi:MAG: PAS domain-containing sensor histidine kinase [Rhodospirillales bacterium]|nr:PAS domain-containing sensor histidine kinase [Rhodospirillales bacterium]